MCSNVSFSIQKEHELAWIEGQIHENTKKGIKHSDLKKKMHPLECSKENNPNISVLVPEESEPKSHPYKY